MTEKGSNGFFISGLRTPFTKAGKGVFAEVRPDDLLVDLISGSGIDRMDAAPPEDLILGCAYPEGEQGYNLARTVAIGCGLDVSGCTVNRLCASSLEAVAIAASRIQCGWGERYLVAGVESMSRIPRRGANFSESTRIKSVNPDAYITNGQTAENVAARFPNLDRTMQESFAARSHELADQTISAGKYKSQLYTRLAQKDEFVRVPVDREKMASLKPAFDENGTVTAATSSPLTDGATAGWVVSESVARSSDSSSGLQIVDVATAHVAPGMMGMGPVPATQRILARNQIQIDQIAAFEINEAFAIQVLASMEELQIPLEKVNTWGGALALGHPLGASGLRLVMTLHNRLSDRGQDGALGLATLCVGGGQGMSILFRYVQFS